MSYDTNDRLVNDGVWSYGWDANGNLTSRTSGPTVETYTYDSRNRLLSFTRTGTNPTTIQYQYDYDNLLASRTVNGAVTRLVWDRGSSAFAQLLEERDGTNTLLRRYEHGDLDITHVRDAGGTASFFLGDQVGTVRAVTDANGNVTTQFVYDAYGKPQGTGPTGIGYTGGYTDPSTGLVYLRSRWYAPALARFIQTDSAAMNLQDTRTLNRYVYGVDDPINRFDPSGQEGTLADALAFLNVFAALSFVTAPILIYGSDPRGVSRSWFGVKNVWEHFRETEDGMFLPLFISADLNANGLVGFGFTAALEAITFAKKNTTAVYISIGPDFKIKKPNPEAPFELSPSLGTGFLYNSPDPEGYAGWSVGVSLSGLGLPLSSKGLQAGTQVPTGGGSFFWSPTTTYYRNPFTGDPIDCKKAACVDDDARHAHGFKLFNGIGESSPSFSFSLTYAFKLK